MLCICCKICGKEFEVTNKSYVLGDRLEFTCEKCIGIRMLIKEDIQRFRR